MLGCGLPGGEQGMNMARIVAVLAGLDDVPGTTVNRYCSSSLQTTRMAFHAIKAGEGDVFVSAGVEAVSRIGPWQRRLHPGPGPDQPPVRRRPGAHRVDRGRAGRPGTTPARRAYCPTPTSRWGRPPRTSPS